jgi:cysteinyl-tRNA synthetase
MTHSTTWSFLLIDSLPLRLTNTYGHKLEVFEPIEEGHVKLYSCGPTVYNYVHIGNFRSFIMADVLRRVLEYNAYRVTQVRNITDVGHLTDETLNAGLDRIEKAARDQKKTPWDIAEHFTAVFRRDATRLNIRPPDFEPRATEYIESMVSLAERLVELGYAYVVDGNVYYEVSKFPRYGQLSGNTVEGLIAGARVEVGEGKRAPADFALWKSAGEDKIMRWPSSWGEGVPGWHLECSAMAFSLLGERIDIHTGGVDNTFPHHEDEIAQSEAASGERFARFWLHGALLNVAGDEKMSKSSGNIYTLDDLASEGIHPLAYRYFTFQANYRTPLNFSWDALNGAQTALFRLWETAAEVHQASGRLEPTESVQPYRRRFHEAINRDLDLPQAISVLHDLAGANLSVADKRWLMADLDRVLGLRLLEMGDRISRLTPEQTTLVESREAARRARDWGESDRIREELSGAGVEVRDTAQGQRWVRRDLLSSERGDSEEPSQDQAQQHASAGAQE